MVTAFTFGAYNLLTFLDRAGNVWPERWTTNIASKLAWYKVQILSSRGRTPDRAVCWLCILLDWAQRVVLGKSWLFHHPIWPECWQLVQRGSTIAWWPYASHSPGRNLPHWSACTPQPWLTMTRWKTDSVRIWRIPSQPFPGKTSLLFAMTLMPMLAEIICCAREWW